MKVWIQNNSKALSQQVAQQLQVKLRQAGITIQANHPDLVITIGGDGTFLSAFHRFNNQLNHLQFIGIHTGHLGFYTDWQDNELDQLVTHIVADDKKVIEYPLLDVQVTYTSQQVAHFWALNEATLRQVSQTMRADVLINDQKFERFRGDGVVVSTPTGSTAYSKSLGGALIDPTLEVMQFNEMAPINNRVYRTVNSSLILTHNQILTVIPDSGSDYIITIDNLAYDHCAIQKIQYKMADQKIKIASYRPKNFWLRVRNAFLVDDQR